MTSHTPHRTPLRRVSQGSLFALSRSGAYPDAPHGLGFLEPAMTELADETETLHGNVEGLRHLSESLKAFNESFSSWLYIMNMNALTVDWPQAPSEASFRLAKHRAEQEAQAALEALEKAAPPPPPAPDPDKTGAMDVEATSAANTTTQPKPKMKKKKATMSAREKRERALELEKVIMALPLEFRGSDPNLRQNMEAVIEGMLNAPTKTVKLPDLIKPPDLNQARVNKCLVTLVNRKMVAKDSSTGQVLYHWRGVQ